MWILDSGATTYPSNTWFALGLFRDAANVVTMTLGGASVDYWEPIAARYGLQLEVVNKQVDPTFRFVPLDHDGKIRMEIIDT
mgnify:CR=1 FL=1